MMKAKDLAEELLKYPDFEVRFSFFDQYTTKGKFELRSFEEVEIIDIGWMDRKIYLGGTEE